MGRVTWHMGVTTYHMHRTCTYSVQRWVHPSAGMDLEGTVHMVAINQCMSCVVLA